MQGSYHDTYPLTFAGDSKLGSMMEKAGDVLNSSKLQEKGAEKRADAGYGGGSGTGGYGSSERSGNDY